MTYEIEQLNGDTKLITNPLDAPPEEKIKEWREPICECLVMTPLEYQSGISSLCDSKRGEKLGTEFINEGNVILKYEIPLAEMVTDFYD